jgi:cell division protein FtsZ
MPLAEIEDAIGMIEQEADENADIIWGSVIKNDLNDEIKVTVIATGFDTASQVAIPQPRMEHTVAVGAPYGGPVEPVQPENMDVPTFIRRQAD